MSQGLTQLPKRLDGSIDKEAVHAMFMASKHLNWTQFAEDQGWDALLSRRQLPTNTWVKEKRDILTERQMDILSGLIHERKFKWTEEILKTLDNYPGVIDMGVEIAKMKMQQIGDLYKDYADNFRGKPELMWTTFKSGRRVRVYHPFEKLSAGDIGAILRSLESLTTAKLKALMLDKWAISKFDMPLEADPGEESTGVGPSFTIEGKAEQSAEQLQEWFDRFHDKPQVPHGEVNAQVKAPEGFSGEGADGGS